MLCFKFTAVCNERETNQQHWTAMGQEPGWPDLTFVWIDRFENKHFGFLELKRKGGKLSRKQQEFLDYWQGFAHIETCYSYKEAVKILKKWFDLEDI